MRTVSHVNASHADVEVIVVVVYSYPLGIKSFYCLSLVQVSYR